ncbi:hypothetical protein L218DRAFT_1001865 [Marasmius fiardii PR-910]|nr:hypothetical protein L218DRAFT_1001865 [Marasmius fiardii PR-910]
MTFLPYFNERVPHLEAYQKSSEKILELFGDFRDHPDYYDVEPNARANMAEAVKTIKERLDQNTCLLDKLLVVQYQGTAEESEFKFETIYDIVGWIFSVVGKTPTGATKENYFWPLLGVYFMFCRKLINNKEKEPQMVQLTFFSQNDGVQRVCLGANLDNPKPSRKNEMQKRRAEQMWQKRLILQNEQEYVDEKLKENFPTEATYPPQKLGHCAETFPLLFIHSLGETAVDAASVGGFAGKMDLAFNFNEQNPVYDKDEVTKNLVSPCGNCEFLIKKNVGWVVQNFAV